MSPTEPVMAVVHVVAPAAVDPGAIEAELARAIGNHRKLAMSAEVTRADEVRPQPHDGPHRHGFVAILSPTSDIAAERLAARVQKATSKALRRRFGKGVTSSVDTEMTAAEQAAYWCTTRGTPHRQY